MQAKGRGGRRAAAVPGPESAAEPCATAWPAPPRPGRRWQRSQIGELWQLDATPHPWFPALTSPTPGSTCSTIAAAASPAPSFTNANSGSPTWIFRPPPSAPTAAPALSHSCFENYATGSVNDVALRDFKQGVALFKPNPCSCRSAAVSAAHGVGNPGWRFTQHAFDHLSANVLPVRKSAHSLRSNDPRRRDGGATTASFRLRSGQSVRSSARHFARFPARG